MFVGHDIPNNLKRISNVSNRLHDVVTSLTAGAVATLQTSNDVETLDLAFDELVTATNQLKLFLAKNTR